MPIKYCFVSLSRGALGWSVIVAFPGYTNLLILTFFFQEYDNSVIQLDAKEALQNV